MSPPLPASLRPASMATHRPESHIAELSQPSSAHGQPSVPKAQSSVDGSAEQDAATNASKRTRRIMGERDHAWRDSSMVRITEE